MADAPLERIVRLYTGRGVIEAIEGDTATTARLWLEQAASELTGVGLLIEAAQYRMAYRAAFDMMRNSAESVVTAAGYRVTSLPGHHEAVFAIANALDRNSSGAFGGARSTQARAKRGSYVDVDQEAEVTRAEAETIYRWASEAVAAAGAIVA